MGSSASETTLNTIASVFYVVGFLTHTVCGVLIFKMRDSLIISTRPRLFYWMTYFMLFILMTFYYTQALLKDEFPCLLAVILRGVALPAMVLCLLLRCFHYYFIYFIVSFSLSTSSSDTSSEEENGLNKPKNVKFIVKFAIWFIKWGQYVTYFILMGLFAIETIILVIVHLANALNVCSPNSEILYAPLGIISVVCCAIVAVLLRKTHDGLVIKREFGYMGLFILFSVIPGLFLHLVLQIFPLANFLFELATIGISAVSYLMVAFFAYRARSRGRKHSSTEDSSTSESIIERDFEHQGFKKNDKIATLFGNKLVLTSFGDFLVHYQHVGAARCFACWREIYSKFKKETTNARRLGHAAIIAQKFLSVGGYLELPFGVLPEDDIKSLSGRIQKEVEDFSAEIEPEIPQDLFDELLVNLERVLEPFIFAFLKDETYKKQFGISDLITAKV